MDIWITQLFLNHIDSSIDFWEDQKKYKISRIFVLTSTQKIYIKKNWPRIKVLQLVPNKLDFILKAIFSVRKIFFPIRFFWFIYFFLFAFFVNLTNKKKYCSVIEDVSVASLSLSFIYKTIHVIQDSTELFKNDPEIFKCLFYKRNFFEGLVIQLIGGKSFIRGSGVSSHLWVMGDFFKQNYQLLLSWKKDINISIYKPFYNKFKSTSKSNSIFLPVSIKNHHEGLLGAYFELDIVLSILVNHMMDYKLIVQLHPKCDSKVLNILKNICYIKGTEIIDNNNFDNKRTFDVINNSDLVICKHGTLGFVAAENDKIVINYNFINSHMFDDMFKNYKKSKYHEEIGGFIAELSKITQ